MRNKFDIDGVDWGACATSIIHCVRRCLLAEPNCALPRFAGVGWNESRLRLEEARVAIWDQLLSSRPRTPVFCCARCVTSSSTFFLCCHIWFPSFCPFSGQAAMTAGAWHDSNSCVVKDQISPRIALPPESEPLAASPTRTHTHSLVEVLARGASSASFVRFAARCRQCRV